MGYRLGYRLQVESKISRILAGSSEIPALIQIRCACPFHFTGVEILENPILDSVYAQAEDFGTVVPEN